MITENTTYKELAEGALKDVAAHIIYSTDPTGTTDNNRPDMTLGDTHKIQPTWAVSDMIYGLGRLEQVVSSGIPCPHRIYSDMEIEADAEKTGVSLIQFPAGKRFAILCSGGGYGAVCNLSEGFPVAAKLNELGITAFCLDYRVGVPPVLPKPVEDIAAAYGYICEHAKELGVDADDYIVGGFSAGGHAAACYGTEELGYRHYGFPAPKLLLLDYPMVNIRRTVGAMRPELREYIMNSYFGAGYSEETCDAYDVDLHLDKEYPPTYLVQADDDPLVPVYNSAEMAGKLRSLGVLCTYEHFPTGGHGFGLGTETDADGWVMRAVTKIL